VKGLSWHQFLDARFDESTVPPHSLKEEALLAHLEGVDPEHQWRQKFSGRMKELLAVLASGSYSTDHALLAALIDERFSKMKTREEEGRSDE
jgi:hypothetical protein